MRAQYPHISLERLCGLLGMKGNSWYHRDTRQSNKPDHSAQVLEMVKVLRARQCKLGTPRLYEHLKPNLEAMGIKMGRNALNDLLQSHGMGIKQRKRRYIKTTDSTHGKPTYPNLIRNFVPDGPHQLWVGDITFLALARGGFCFLFLLTDAYSHKIVGWNLSMTMRAEDGIVALNMALSQLPAEYTLIHHTDRGTQYISEEYTRILKGRKISISMTETGDPKENPVAERMNGILKHDQKLKNEFARFALAKKAAREAIGIYNKERKHSSCDYLTPEQAHLKTGILPKRWKNYRKDKAIRLSQPGADKATLGTLGFPVALPPPTRLDADQPDDPDYGQNPVK